MIRFHFNQRRRLYLGLAVAGCLLAAGFLLVRPSSGIAATGPRIYIPGCPSLSLGAGRPGDELQGSFEIGNYGTELLTFSLRSGCGCLTLEPKSGEVQPGDKLTVTVKVRLRRKGQDEDVTVWLGCNDETKPQIHYSVVASCPKTLAPTPSRIDFGPVLAGQGATRMVLVNSACDVASVKLACTTNLSMNRDTVTADPHNSRFELLLNPSTPTGHFQGTVTLSAPDGDEETVIVSAQVCPPIVASPEYLLLPGKSAAKHTVRCVVRRFDGRSLGRLQRVEGPPWLTVIDQDSDTATQRCLSFVVAEAGWTESDRISAKLWFRGTSDSAQVTFVTFSE